MVVRAMLLMAFLVLAQGAEARSGYLQNGLPYEASAPTIDDVGQGNSRWRMNVTVTNTGTYDTMPFLDTVLHMQPIRSPIDNSMVSEVTARPERWDLPPGQSHQYVIEATFPRGGVIQIVEAFPLDDCTKTSAEIVERIADVAKAYPLGEDKAREQWLANFTDGHNLGRTVPGCQGTNWQARACLNSNLVALPETPTNVNLTTKDYADANGRHFEINLEITGELAYSSVFWSEDSRANNGGGSGGGGPTCGNNRRTASLHAQFLDNKLYTCLVNGTYHLLAYYHYDRIEHYQFEVTDVPPEMQCGAKSKDDSPLGKMAPSVHPIVLVAILGVLARRRT